jgi:hypothetical protein
MDHVQKQPVREVPETDAAVLFGKSIFITEGPQGRSMRAGSRNVISVPFGTIVSFRASREGNGRPEPGPVSGFDRVGRTCRCRNPPGAFDLNRRLI